MMLADYDVTNGRMWVPVRLALLVLPTVVRTLQAPGARPEGGHDDVSG
jgi:hypothetical protein